jgi:Ca2+-binding RTX toxin-like protein
MAWLSRWRQVSVAAVALALLVAVVAIARGGEAAGAAPPCAASPSTSKDGTTVIGSPCRDTIVVTSAKVRTVVAGDGDDVVYVNPDVVEVLGEGGEDTIFGELPEAEEEVSADAPSVVYEPLSASASSSEPIATASETCTTNPCYGGLGNQVLKGGPGDDRIFGQRGNDTLFGEDGNDSVFGGTGDDRVFGNEHNDLLSGGYGAEAKIDGGNGSDLVRGDGSLDVIEDQGSTGIDTLSYATSATPGFTSAVAVPGFPAAANNEERGVSVNLEGTDACAGYEACNNGARWGGGNDVVQPNVFENVIGSPFADRIMGSATANRIDGGGGTDVLIGGAGNDNLHGGAESDYLEGGSDSDTGYGEGGVDNCALDVEGRPECEGSAAEVIPRDRTKVSVGLMVSTLPGNLTKVEFYVLGSKFNDDLLVGYRIEKDGQIYVDVTTLYDSIGRIDMTDNARTGTCRYEEAGVTCPVPRIPDAYVVAGMAGDDHIRTVALDLITSPVLLGGEGKDLVQANALEDVLVDGNGVFEDSLFGRGGDDALINNEGPDFLYGGNGNDLLVSPGVCEGDTLDGAEAGSGDAGAQNNSSWAQVPGGIGGVIADLAEGKAGTQLSNGKPTCPAPGVPTTLVRIDDLEGSNQGDTLFGNEVGNSFFGRPGNDSLYPRAGEDFVEAADGVHDDINGGDNPDVCNWDVEVDSRASCEGGEGK